ncbi:hydantoinase/oxoprolinase N-terminal domain-containing protein [Actinomadura chibensis]|uniref:Hydantoinase/oxoprolinase family protein n=1 Tax=Actinomadura chibensis TaxID=392828 RepID=A0A5D0NNI3_9ACTN|nr:hydantoinase/oxoprolinase N-terminal domain-containing protein [Actinomadura chibensis]TYB45581.1 hydantoinase/oxoprolinase family protein [Actinomadura chibensis]
MRIGIDVGMTNTDAVLISGATVVEAVKTTTTPDVTSGIAAAIGELRRRPSFDPGAVAGVAVATPCFSLALAEARRLARTAVIRLCLPATAAAPPLIGWPGRLVRAIGGHSYLCRGGHEFDGRVISVPDPDELRRVAADLAAKRIRSVAISSVFSPGHAEFEVLAADILTSEMEGLHVSLSHEIGRTGLLERENATVVNACLRDIAERFCLDLSTALRQNGLDAALYLSRNDGTVMDVDSARSYPAAALYPRAANSLNGAACLSGLDTCTVVDAGGTTTAVGTLHRGVPREAGGGAVVAGVRTDLRVPDVRTMEDLDSVIDRIRTRSAPDPVVLVGGGSPLIGDRLGVAARVHRPEHFAVAGAVGAAIAHVGGEVDRVFAVEPGDREAVRSAASQEAIDRTVAAGADPGTVRVVEVEEFPIAGLPGNAVRVRVRAVGDLDGGTGCGC